MRVYADTNLFTRFYLPLAESGKVAALLERAADEGWPPFPVTWLHKVEVINAIHLYVFAGKSRGHPRVTPEQAAAACAFFQADLEQSTFLRPLPMNWEKLKLQVEELTLRHTAIHGFRAYDILHVAIALEYQAEAFWSFDAKASRLAGLEGLDVL